MITTSMSSVYSRIKEIRSGLKNLAQYSKPERVKEFESMLKSSIQNSSEQGTTGTNGYHPYLHGFEANSPAPARVTDGQSAAADLDKKQLTEALKIQDAIDRAAAKYGVSRELIKAVIRVESAYDPNAVSHAGAQGLMQLMPATAQNMGVTDSFDIYQNIDGGTKYLKLMLDQYQGDLDKALAAYNAGPHRVDQYNGVPRIDETQNYVLKVKKFYFNN